VEAVKSQAEHAIQIAREAWEVDVLARAQLTADELRTHLGKPPDRKRRVFECAARQVIELRTALDRYNKDRVSQILGPIAIGPASE
jgi:hypothetical protein